MLFGIATLSSIHALCNNFIPTHENASARSIGIGHRSSHQTSICISSPAITAEQDLNEGGRPKRNKRRLTWRETLPVLSAVAPKQEGRSPREERKENTSICEEDRRLEGQSNPRNCFCHLIWESFGFVNKPENSLVEDGIENTTFVTSDEQQVEPTKRFPTAFTPEIINLSKQKEMIVKKMRKNVFDKVPDFEKRSSLVPWGGLSPRAEALSYDWYAPKNVHKGLSAPIDQIDGGNLFSSYLRIMKWPNNSIETDFPFKLCKEKKKNEGTRCDISDAIQHTLEFRERFKPWLVTPRIKKANMNGLVYTRGFSPPHSDHEQGGHAIVWMRLALRVKTNDEHDRIYFVRSMIREFDRAVAASLKRSNGRLGKFNAVVDGEDFTWGSLPSLSAVKTLVAVLQDHFADRLGVLILVNVGSIGEILLKLFLPLITEEVRNKIVVLPHNEKERLEALKLVLGRSSNIPVRLGGTDDYVYNVDEYYKYDSVGRDEEALEYLTTMPYHA